jgi:hypothetical protein
MCSADVMVAGCVDICVYMYGWMDSHGRQN